VRRKTRIPGSLHTEYGPVKMKNSFLVFFSWFSCSCILNAQDQVPAWNPESHSSSGRDWLVTPITEPAGVFTQNQGKELVLYNGLLRRVFRLQPNLACIDFTNTTNQQQLLRATSPEARLVLDGETFNIGGLYGQKEKAYLRAEWMDSLSGHENDFQFTNYSIAGISPRINWKTSMWHMEREKASGKTVSFEYRHPRFQGLKVSVHYDLYDGLPLICKWVSIRNDGRQTVRIDRVINEILAMVEEESAVIGKPDQMKTPQGLYIESNYAFNNAMRYALSDQTTHWKTDSSYTSQVNYNYETPCLLEVYPTHGPGIELPAGAYFESIRTYELLLDSYDRERRGLAVRKMYRVIAPWTNTNPIFMHLVSRSDEEVRQAIDQCAATGYEALILSFGSHCNIEDTSAANLIRWKTLADYAHSKNIFIGSYSLFSSRRISDEEDVINPATGKPGGAFFGNAPCFGSAWGQAYSARLKTFFQATGFDLFENDGPYPGDLCASKNHPGHQGLEDSQWRQMEMQKDLYRWCTERGIYINAPDWYFLDGTHKIALGYREVNFSLPREQQVLLNRQNIYDGTWEKNSSMAWGFVPLTKYHGGGPEAVLEPLHAHLEDYEKLMTQYYGAGVQACYRGPRLFDTEETKSMVIRIIGWYKIYREILNSDLIHLRRADGRDWDGWLHVNPGLKDKGFLQVFNPLNHELEREIRIPLYYTGLTTKAILAEKDGRPVKYRIDRDYSIKVRVRIPAASSTWFVIR